MTKGLADGTGDWLEVVEELYFRASDEAFWRAESYLSAVERLEYGVTTSLSYTGSCPGSTIRSTPRSPRRATPTSDSVTS